MWFSARAVSVNGKRRLRAASTAAATRSTAWSATNAAAFWACLSAIDHPRASLHVPRRPDEELALVVRVDGERHRGLRRGEEHPRHGLAAIDELMRARLPFREADDVSRLERAFTVGAPQCRRARGDAHPLTPAGIPSA